MDPLVSLSLLCSGLALSPMNGVTALSLSRGPQDDQWATSTTLDLLTLLANAMVSFLVERFR